MNDLTIQSIRDTFGAGTIESWLDREGFDELEEAVAEWGVSYVFDEIDAFVHADDSDFEIEADDLGEDEDYLGYN